MSASLLRSDQTQNRTETEKNRTENPANYIQTTQQPHQPENKIQGIVGLPLLEPNLKWFARLWRKLLDFSMAVSVYSFQFKEQNQPMEEKQREKEGLLKQSLWSFLGIESGFMGEMRDEAEKVIFCLFDKQRENNIIR